MARPYECVRRGWHSDMHQPMRGSIIQHIFRAVNEAHSLKTKSNKEWQEKIPMVVFRVEEIMYSKANSEAEYVDSDTLWDRANDVVNTIIRREEGNETGELLPACVEASLNLGCVAVRASRSQRHSKPRSYLMPRPQEHLSPPARISDEPSDERRLPFSPPHYGSNCQSEATHLRPHVPENTFSRTKYVGTPVTSIQEPTKHIFTSQMAENTSSRIPQVDVMDIAEDIGSSISQQGGSFATRTDYDPSMYTSSMWNSEGEDWSLEAALRKKRKVNFGNNEEGARAIFLPGIWPEQRPVS